MTKGWTRSFRCVVVALAAAAAGLSAPASAQEQASPYAEDVASLDAIMAAIYDVISGEAGEERDWDRFRALFHPGARLIPYNPDSEAGAVALSPEAYIERAEAAFAEDGFFEREIGRTTEQFGDITHLMSAYAATRAADDAEPFLRGVNSFQLLRHDGRWWIMTIFWQAETDDTPIPAEYLASD